MAGKERKPRKKLSVILKEFRSDIKKITWPSGKSVVKNSIMVIITMLIASTIISLVDLGLIRLLELIIS